MDAQELGKYFVVGGRVQGVGFRRFTQDTGLRLKLKGWVRNLSDGRVEGVAFGASENLKSFIESLLEGPSVAVVDHLDIYSLDLKEESSQNELKSCEGFQINQDGDTAWMEQK